MRTSPMVLASLLCIQFLATTAHGIRLDRQLHDALNSKQELADDSKAGEPSDAVAHSTSWGCTSDGNCSGMGKKPLAPHSAPSTPSKHQVQTTSKKRRSGDEQSQHEAEVTTATNHAGGSEAAAKTWSRRALPRQPKTYPDILDIAGMDYSPATRKPPIHN